MDQSTNYKHKIDFLISDDVSFSQPSQTIVKSKYKKKKCNECNKRRKTLHESHNICHVCYKTKTIYKPKQSGNKVIDDFIRHTQIDLVKKGGVMEFVPYDQFKDIEFIAEGGFSKIYKATWIDGPINENCNNKNGERICNYAVVLKILNNSKSITPKELNELKVFYDFSSKYKQGSFYSKVSEYYGITQDPITQNIMIIMPYYDSGDLRHYLTNDIYNLSWYDKLVNLRDIAKGLADIHGVNILHRDLHSGNIFFKGYNIAIIGDLGINKSAIESTGDNDENYGIIPYMAPEILRGQKYATASDIYSFGMIMWEFITGRRPFWDRIHDADLIIEICDGLRPPIVTIALEGYIELMKECWHSDPEKRPAANDLFRKIDKMADNEEKKYKKPTEIVKSPDIGPVTLNNPGAIYNSRPLSNIIQSAMSIRSSRSQTINLEFDRRKFDNSDNGQSIKRRKLLENENNDK